MEKKLRLNGIMLGQCFEMLKLNDWLKQYKLLQTKGPIFLSLGQGLDRMPTLFLRKFDGILGLYCIFWPIFYFMQMGPNLIVPMA